MNMNNEPALSPRRRLSRTMHQWGPRGVVAFATAAVVVAVVLLVGYIQGGEPLGDTGIGDTTRLVPATGQRGFNLQDFVCGPGDVKVKLDPTPDGSAGTYQITRTLNGVFESVKLIQGAETGTHYWDGANGQESEPAFVTPGALKCIEEKRQ